MAEPTPRPWKVNQAVIAANAHKLAPGSRERDVQIANAALIVRAVNAHDALLALLTEIAPDIDCQCGSGVPVPCWRCRADEALRAAQPPTP